MKSTPQEWRTDHLVCPLNAGKLASVVELVRAMRQCAGREAALQWQQFYRKEWSGFESMAAKGWGRPWVASGILTTSHGQMVMAQVAASLQGYFGNVMNTYTALVSGSTLSPAIRHQLHSINRKKAWFQAGEVTVEQVTVSASSTGKTAQHKAKIVIGPEIRTLARRLIRRAISQHRKPHFRAFQPQIDQRGAFLQNAHTAKSQDLWLTLLARDGDNRIAIPVEAHPHFLERQKEAIYHDALGHAGDRSARIFAGIKNATKAKTKEDVPEKSDKKKKAAWRLLADEPERNPYPCEFSLARTIRLLLAPDGISLSLAVATDMKSTFEQSAATYTPKMGMYILDTGMCTLFGSDQGDLLGRNWMVKLERYDRLLQAIAKHRQQLGLKVASPRYRMIVASLRGYLKTEINRIFNRLVELKAPSGFVLEEPGFYLNPKLSKRLNRIMSNFGAGLITAKLKELEVRFGITAQFIPAAYSSQTCSGCEYVDKKNRPKQAQFHCKFCNLKLHADVNAPRNLSARRSRVLAQSSEQGFAARPHRKHILVETIRRFNERYTRQRVWPSDPRFNNPYYKDWAAKVRSPGIRTSPSSQGALGSPTLNANRANQKEWRRREAWLGDATCSS